MTDQLASTSAERATASAASGAEMAVELVIDSYRVTGDLRSPGAPRRLVDVLNLSDDPFVAVRKGALDDPLAEGDEPRRFETMQVHREAILFAIPRSDADVHPDPFDIVKKVPVPANVTVPGFEIAGNVYLLPEIDAATAHIVGSHHFSPMSEVSIRAVGHSEATWSEPVIVVNLLRVQMFAPRG